MSGPGNPSPDGRTYPARPFLAVSVAVFRGGQVLIACREGKPAPGRWSLPGGGVETGETLAEAALRELDEETGVSARIIAPAHVSEIIRRDDAGRVERHFVIVSFAAVWASGEPRALDKTSAVAWASEDDLAGFELTERTAEAIARARAVLVAVD